MRLAEAGAGGQDQHEAPSRAPGLPTDPLQRLQARERQQAAIARVGLHALRDSELQPLFDQVVATVAESLEVEFAKVLEMLADGSALRLVSGVGWRAGLVGRATVGTGAESQAGYTLCSQEPVIVEDLQQETRFRAAPLLVDHGVVSGLSVVIEGRERPFGVLGAHTARRRAFTADDLSFLQAVANVLAAAIDRRRMDEELQTAHQRNVDILESITDGFYALDEAFCFTYVDRRAEQVWGKPRQELLGKNLWEQFPQAVGRESYQAHLRAVRERRPVTFETWSRDLNTWFEGTVYPGRAGLSVYFRDVSERKQAEARQLELEIEQAERLATEAANQQLRAIQAITDATLAHLTLEASLQELVDRIRDVLQVDLVTILLPDAAEQALRPRVGSGLGAEEVRQGVAIPLGAGFAGRVAAERRPLSLDLVGPGDLASPLLFERGVRSMLGAPLVVESRLLGIVRVATLQPRRFDEHETHLLQLVADRAALAIEHAQLYESERQARAEAQAAEARYRGLFEGVVDAVLVADEAGRYLDANPAAVRLTGYSRDELLGMRVSDLPAHEPIWSEVEYARFLQDRAWRGEFELRRKDGTIVPVEARATAIELPDGRLNVATLRNVSERRRLERLQRNFLMLVSYELRHPLAAIVGQVQRVARRRASPDQAIEVIGQQARHLYRLINDLVNVAQLEAGRLELRLTRVNLARLVRAAVERALSLSPCHTIRLEAPGGAIVGRWDRDRLEQVVDNLLAAAIRRAPPDGEILVRLETTPSEIGLTVWCPGCRVSPHELARLFDRFGPASGEGRGWLGRPPDLWITRSLVEAHGGRIWADSRHGQGLSLAFTLPTQGPARPDQQPLRLTPRQLQIARLIAQGRTNREIAEQLVLSKRTVDNHVQRLLGDLGASNRAEVARWVAEQGLAFSAQD